jgi:hypothetical protein
MMPQTKILPIVTEAVDFTRSAFDPRLLLLDASGSTDNSDWNSEVGRSFANLQFSPSAGHCLPRSAYCLLPLPYGLSSPGQIFVARPKGVTRRAMAAAR